MPFKKTMLLFRMRVRGTRLFPGTSSWDFGEVSNCGQDREKRFFTLVLYGRRWAIEWFPATGRIMKQSTENEIKGNLHVVKGIVKEKAGEATNNPNLTAEGQDEKFAGKVQKKIGQVEAVLEK
jgi:uncharacterized protein YjbJ (UPF0337 family)